MAQGNYIEEAIKRNGRQFNHEERTRKRAAREAHKQSEMAQTLHGHKAKLLHARRYAEKVAMKKTIKAHEERNVKAKDASAVPEGALPTYLLDREGQNDAKALSSAVKQKRKEKAGKFAVPLPKVRGIAEDEMFKVVKTGKTKRKGWKRMVTKATFVGEVRSRSSPPPSLLRGADFASRSARRSSGLYSQASQARAFHSAISSACEEGQRDSPCVAALLTSPFLTLTIVLSP
jgi:ribosome biogenesis protein NSA2